MRLAVFDLDGTLIDSQRDLADFANALIVERGGRPLPLAAVTGMIGEGAKLLVTRALTAAGLEPEIDTALPRFLEIYDERLLVHTRLYPGTEDALAAIAEQAALALLTNKPQRHTERILDELKIAAFFRDVVGGDTPFGRKPDPTGLHHVMAQAGAAPHDTLFFGDSAIDLRTARAGGTPICLVRYGFGFRLAAVELRGDELFADATSDLPRLFRTHMAAAERGDGRNHRS